ncbi:DNA-binding NarL/FixJ family response regulator [Brevundimonas lenta]|uniref:DNA-binding NarL/FixJ family response regulator n=1 Tax=Brevundimonas lenta TaxID=424796 RepID=A0A7W6JDL9_9CAUL|nr:DNA-binding NarL/FixJ family response regulator [Brevundimonas lenta]
MLERDLGIADVAGVEDIVSLHELLRNGRSVEFVVLDAELPGLDGAAGLRRLTSAFPELGVVVMASHAGLDCVDAAPAAGVRGCLMKDRPDDEISAVLRAIFQGQAFVSAAVDSARSADPVDALTSRQRTVVEMLASGRSNKEIGYLLGICEGTVKVHLLAAFRQMGVRNRVQAVTALHGRSGQPLLPGVYGGRA